MDVKTFLKIKFFDTRRPSVWQQPSRSIMQTISKCDQKFIKHESKSVAFFFFIRIYQITRDSSLGIAATNICEGK